MQTKEISGPEKALQHILLNIRGVTGLVKRFSHKIRPKSEGIQQVNSSTRSATVDLFAHSAVMSVLSRLIDVRNAGEKRGQSGLLGLIAAAAQCWEIYFLLKDVRAEHAKKYHSANKKLRGNTIIWGGSKFARVAKRLLGWPDKLNADQEEALLSEYADAVKSQQNYCNYLNDVRGVVPAITIATQRNIIRMYKFLKPEFLENNETFKSPERDGEFPHAPASEIKHRAGEPLVSTGSSARTTLTALCHITCRNTVPCRKKVSLS